MLYDWGAPDGTALHPLSIISVLASMSDPLRSDTRALIVFNPKAGQATTLAHDLQAAREVWRARGWRVDVQPTGGPGDGTRIARAAAEQGYDVVVAAGG